MPLERPAEAGRPLSFKAGMRVRVVPGEGAYVFSERGVTALRGAAAEALAPLLDGSRDLAELRRAPPDGLSPEAVESLVRRLDAAGLLGAQPPVPEEEAAFWDACGVDPAEAAPRVGSTSVLPLAVGGTDPAAVAEALKAAGLAVEPALHHRPGGPGPALAPGSDGLSVVVCPDYLAAGLDEIDAAHRAQGRPWLLARPTGTTMWVGPLFAPRLRTGCWHCLAARLRLHRQGELHARGSAALGLPAPAVTALSRAAAGVIAFEAAKWAAGHRHERQGDVWTLDTVSLEGRRHRMSARPQCPECGDPALSAERARRPPRLVSRPKAGDSQTGHRSRTAEETWADYAHLVSPATGLVKEVTPVTGLPEGVHVHRSGPNRAAPGSGAAGMRAALRRENSGKGTTAEQSRVSALCEALERHSGAFQGDEERVRGSYAELADEAVHPDACLLYAPGQYADRQRWNAEHGAFQYVCAPFDDDARIDWSPVWTLEGRRRLLPTALLYFGAPVGQEGSDGGGEPMVIADSNGNAAGSCLEDAVLQGALEVVERDAVALWWYNRTRQRGVDLAAFGDPFVARMSDVYAGMDREFWVLDLTSDLGIPAMAAVTRRTGAPEEVMFGFGAHLDPEVALRRAVAEMNQLLSTLVKGPGGWEDPDAVRWLEGPGTRDAPHLLPDPGQEPAGPGSWARAARADLHADVLEVRDRFARAGLEMLVLDQTRPDIGMPVAKVVVPGMRGFWARFGPGRLFDVPVRLGRVPAPTAYADLNPDPLFL